MLGGVDVTSKAREHAREMLQAAGKRLGGAPVGTVGLAAVAVEDQGMIPDRESQPLRDGRLPLLYPGIHELFDPAAVQADDMIVMRALVELEDRHAVLEVMAGDQAGGLELREHAVDGGEPDVLVGLEQGAIDVLG